MAILNYTTQIAAEKTVAEIQTLLVKAKASAIMNEFDDGVLSAVSFRIQTPKGLLTFQLPGKVEQVFKVMARDRKIAPRLKTREQAARVAWRITKDWLEAQLAFVEAEMVDIAQVFLSFMQVTPDGKTLYEALEQRGFNTSLMLEDKQ